MKCPNCPTHMQPHHFTIRTGSKVTIAEGMAKFNLAEVKATCPVCSWTGTSFLHNESFMTNVPELGGEAA